MSQKRRRDKLRAVNEAMEMDASLPVVRKIVEMGNALMRNNHYLTVGQTFANKTAVKHALYEVAEYHSHKVIDKELSLHAVHAVSVDRCSGEENGAINVRVNCPRSAAARIWTVVRSHISGMNGTEP